MIETDVLVIGGGTSRFFSSKNMQLLVGQKSFYLIKDLKSVLQKMLKVFKKVLQKLGIEPSPRWITKEIDGVRLTSPDGTDVWLTEEEN